MPGPRDSGISVDYFGEGINLLKIRITLQKN